MLAGRLAPLPVLLGPRPGSLRVGWRGFRPAWRLTAAQAGVPGEPCRSCIAFCDQAQTPGHCFGKFKSTDSRRGNCRSVFPWGEQQRPTARMRGVENMVAVFSGKCHPPQAGDNTGSPWDVTTVLCPLTPPFPPL